MIHRRTKERKSSTEEASHKSIRGNGTICVEQIYIDDIFEPLYEDDEHSTTNWNRTNHLRRPRCTRMASPRKPEEAARKNDSADDHRRKTTFRHKFTGGAGGLAGESGESVGDGGYEAQDDADEERNESKGCLAGCPVPVLDKGDGKSFEEEEEHAIEEALVECYEYENGFGAEEDCELELVTLLQICWHNSGEESYSMAGSNIP